MSDQATIPHETNPEATEPVEEEVTLRRIVDNDLDDAALEEAYLSTMVGVEDGQLVTGTVVKVDMDEVLLDIGYKSEGVIPSRELSIRNDVDPHEVVSLGDELEALVLQKEDKEGRLLLSKKRAQYERAWGKIEEIDSRLRSYARDMGLVFQITDDLLDVTSTAEKTGKAVGKDKDQGKATLVSAHGRRRRPRRSREARAPRRRRRSRPMATPRPELANLPLFLLDRES